MRIKTTINHNETIRRLTPAEKTAGQKVIGHCMAVKQNERVLVLTDAAKLDKEAAIFFETAKRFTKQVKLIVFSGMEENAQEPPKTITDELIAADIALLVTTYSLTHTNARQQATNAGTRIASMPGITHATILRTLCIDYAEVAQLSKKIATILTAGKKALLSSPNGTEAVFGLEGSSGIADTGLFTNPGDYGNLPAGEGFIAPAKDTSEGIIVFDGCFANIKLDSPIKVLVEKGRVTDIQGGEAARLLNARLAKIGKLGYNIAELGIGTNKTAQLGSELLEVEKVYATAHVALGNNATIGGEVDVPFHSDGVILKPTLRVDDTFILKNGRFAL